MRVRPILMTAASIILGLLPILFGGGSGSELMSGIAIGILPLAFGDH